MANLKAGRAAQGGSTITMQLVKNLYLGGQDTSITDKIYEASLALQYQQTHSKDAILTNYLNTVFFGANAYGLEAASETYFGKEPKALTLPEAALLAGLLQAPSTYNPRGPPASGQESTRTLCSWLCISRATSPRLNISKRKVRQLCLFVTRPMSRCKSPMWSTT